MGDALATAESRGPTAVPLASAVLTSAAGSRGVDRPGHPDRQGRRAPRYQPLVIVLAAVGAGIVGDRYWPLPLGTWWAVAAGAWAVWLGLWLAARRKGWEMAAAVALLAAAAATAAAWHHCRWRLFPRDDLGCYARAADQPVCIEAIALSSARSGPSRRSGPLDPIPLGHQVQLDIELTGLRDGRVWREVAGRARLSVAGSLDEVQAGDRLRVFGQLVEPRGVQNPGGFDYAAYLRVRRLRSLVRTQFAQCVSVVASGSNWSPSRWIDLARTHGNRILQRYVEPQRAALASSLLIGTREELDPAEEQAFLETGTIHILSISGMHVNILAGALLLVMLRAPVPRGLAMSAVAAVVLFYMLLADAQAPVVRASVLVLVVCFALCLRRRPLSFNSLAAAALIVLVQNPAELFQVGPQLSFLAVAGLIGFAPYWSRLGVERDPLERLIERSHGWSRRRIERLWWWAVQLTVAGAIVWLLALPLVMARFHLLTPVGIVLTTLLWIPMSLSLLFGFATLTLGAVSPLLGRVLGGVCDVALDLLQGGVTWAQGLPGSHYWIPGPADWWLAGCYGGIGVLAAFPQIRPPRRWCLAMLAGWSTVGLAAGLPRHAERLDCTFLSMGHGSATVLQLPDGRTMLYDAGQLGSASNAARSIAECLWSQGITHLDAVVLSHGDVDHYNALPELLDRFSVGVVYVSPMMFDNGNPATKALEEAIRLSGVPLREIYAGDVLAGNGSPRGNSPPNDAQCRIEVLHPPEQGVFAADNANSIVLDVQYRGRRILLPGDLEPPGLDYLLAEEPIDYDVLLVPHHGSQQSRPSGLAAWATAEWVVISGSRRFDVTPIQTAYQAAGSAVLHTAETGAVRVSIDSSGVKVAGFSGP